MSKPIDRVAKLFSSPKFREDFRYWVKTDRKAALRVMELVAAMLADPFDGIGKPEALRFMNWPDAGAGESLKNIGWSIESVADRIEFLQARYHYE